MVDLLVLGGHLRADGQHGRLLVALHPASVHLLLFLFLDPLALDHFGAVAGHRARPLIGTSHRRWVGPRSVTSLFSLLTSIGGRPDVSPSLHSCLWLRVQQHITSFVLLASGTAPRGAAAQRDSVIRFGAAPMQSRNLAIDFEEGPRFKNWRFEVLNQKLFLIEFKYPSKVVPMSLILIVSTMYASN